MKIVAARRGSDVPVVVETEPQDVASDQVRVKVLAAGFTYFDAFLPTQQEAFGLPEQVGLGFDFSGTVTEVGAAVSDLAVGDVVAGLVDDLTAPVRAHAEELVVAATAVAVVPEGLDPRTAAVVPLSALTARQALDLLGAERGTLLVTGGAGSIGAWLRVLAKRDGWSVTSLVRPGTGRGAADGSEIEELGGTYDAVLDAAALGEAVLGAVRDGGRYVSFKPGRPLEAGRDIEVLGVMVVPDGASLAELLPLAASGDVEVRIAGESPLVEAEAAYEKAGTASGTHGRWLLVP